MGKSNTSPKTRSNTSSKPKSKGKAKNSGAERKGKGKGKESGAEDEGEASSVTAKPISKKGAEPVKRRGRSRKPNNEDKAEETESRKGTPDEPAREVHKRKRKLRSSPQVTLASRSVSARPKSRVRNEMESIVEIADERTDEGKVRKRRKIAPAT